MAEHRLALQTEAPRGNSPVPHVLAVASITQRLGQQWIEKARHHHFALASGPSGIGKSILMHQIVVPALRNEDEETPIIAFMPGDSSQGFFDSLWKALGKTEPLPDDPQEALTESLVSFSPTGRSILVIDGLDQVFSQSNIAADQALAFLWKAAQENYATVIGALRCPFLEPISKLLPANISVDDWLIEVTPPGSEDRRILATEGVQLVSPQLEKTDPGVLKRLIREINHELDQAPQALAFLSLLLERWRSQVACGDLSVMNWLRSNGLAGEIAAHIEEKFSSLKPRLRKQLGPILRLLVSWSDELSPIPCHVSYQEIETLGGDAIELTNVLLYERVLYITGDSIDSARVNFIHPGVIQEWTKAREILDEERKDLSAKRLLDAQALHWDSNGRRPEDQWLEGDVLLTAQTLLLREAANLPRITADFLRTFDEEANERVATTRKLRQIVKPLSMLLILIAITRSLLVMTQADLSPSGPIMEATATRSNSDASETINFADDHERSPAESRDRELASGEGAPVAATFTR